MVLELATFQIDDLIPASETKLVGGILSINIEELKSLLVEDSLFADVGIEIVRPGEDVRLIHIIDVVEPRARISQPGSDFPGLIGPPQTVGAGRTHRLSGVAVVEASEPVPGETTYWREAIIEMSGEGARCSPFSSLINLVLTFKPRLEQFAATDSGTNPENLFGGSAKAIEYNRAVRRAGLKAAIYLAQTTINSTPDQIDGYDLKPVSNLPRVVYLMQTLAYVYGEMTPGVVGHAEPGVLPTIIHPAEILDGALVNSFNPPACMREATWLMQNHAVIHDLFARHGNELDFRGVVLYSYGDSVKEKERTANYAANLARILGADGALLTTLGGGHPSVDVMMICERLERQGMKTTLLLMEMAARPEDSGFVHFVREADAIVSTGNYETQMALPARKKVLGGERIFESNEDAHGPLTLTLRHFLGSTNPFGHSSLRGREY